jgi:hypothetical protein
MSDSTKIRNRAALTTSERFQLEAIPTRTGRWAARLWYTTRQGRSRNRVCYATLREPERGGIIFDLGSRGSKGRMRLGTRDLQEAIDAGEALLERIGLALVGKDDVERMMQDARGDLSIPQLSAVFFAEKGPHRRSGIGKHHADNMVRMFDVMFELNGPGWTVSHADQEWIDEMIDQRMKGITFQRVAGRRPLGTVEWNTARDMVGYFMGAVSVACRTPDPNREGRMMQDVDPFAREGVELPKGRAPQPKRSVGIEHHLRLMNPIARGEEILPAPVDRADPSGAIRLMQAAFFHFGVRRAQLRIAKRRHIARTAEEVQTMIAKHGHSIRNQDWQQFAENGLWLFEGSDSKMAHVDAEGYTRVLPIPRELREEVDLYFERNPSIEGDGADAPLFRSASDPTKPLTDRSAFGSHEWKYLVDSAGKPIIDALGKKVVKAGEDGRWLIRRQGGRYRRAEEIARDDMAAEGLDWQTLFPYELGSVVHSWRGHLEVLFETLQYIREVVTEDGGTINLVRHVDYILMRKLDNSVRFTHYIPMDPTILLGMIELREADEVLATRGVRRAEEVAAGIAKLAAARATLRFCRPAA